jgi:hypothetical protein
MRAHLTAPALATWLVVGTIVCIIWNAPWYIGALSGLAAAAVAYGVLVALEPRWHLIPDWVSHAISTPFYAAFAIWFYARDPRFDVLALMFGLLAASSALNLFLALSDRKKTNSLEA